MIEEGRDLVTVALTGGLREVRAMIAALHGEAADVATADWPQLVALHDVLLTLTPVVALNRAAAGHDAGLTLLDELIGEPQLRAYHLLPVTRADSLREFVRLPEAAEALTWPEPSRYVLTCATGATPSIHPVRTRRRSDSQLARREPVTVPLCRDATSDPTVRRSRPGRRGDTVPAGLGTRFRVHGRGSG